jgi:hypothetical protein
VNPVFALCVANAAIQSVRSQHEEEVASLSDALQKVVVKLAGFQPLHIDEDGERPQMQMDLQQTVHDKQSSTLSTYPSSYEIIAITSTNYQAVTFA